MIVAFSRSFEDWKISRMPLMSLKTSRQQQMSKKLSCMYSLRIHENGCRGIKERLCIAQRNSFLRNVQATDSICMIVYRSVLKESASLCGLKIFGMRGLRAASVSVMLLFVTISKAQSKNRPYIWFERSNLRWVLLYIFCETWKLVHTFWSRQKPLDSLLYLLGHWFDVENDH